MPSKSPAQAKLMQAVAHGWKPSRMKGPSRAVAQEFVEADKKYSGGFAENRYWTGGLAAMNEINSGVPVTLQFQRGGRARGRAARRRAGMNGGTSTTYTPAVEPTPTPAWEAPSGWAYGSEPLTYQAAMDMDDLSGMANLMGPLANFQRFGWTQVKDPDNPDDLRASMWYPPGSTAMGGVEPIAPIGTEPRDIPGAAGQPPAGGAPPQWTPEERAAWEAQQAAETAASRQSPYRDQLRAHKARVASALRPGPLPPTVIGGGNMMSGQMVPPGAIGGDLQNPIYGARGGHMNYQEGGTAQPAQPAQPTRRKPTGNLSPVPGHQEGQNPNVPGTALYRHWENTFHVDPPAPPPPPPPPEEPGFFSSLFGFGAAEEGKTRTEKELEAIGEHRGGRVGYQAGGLARVAPPVGGIPPWVEPAGYVEPEGYQRGGLSAMRRQAGQQGGAGRWSPQQQQSWRGRQRQVAQAQPQGGGGRWSPQQQQAWRGRQQQPGGMAGARQAFNQQRALPQQRSAMMAQAQRQQALQQQGAGAGRMGQARADFAAQRALPQQLAGRMAGMQADYQAGQRGLTGGGVPGGTQNFLFEGQPQQPQSIADRLGGSRFGEDMRFATGRQSYQDVVNRGGGGINPRLPGGGRMYGSAPQPGMAYAGGTPGYYGPGGPGRGPSIGGGIPGGPRVPPNQRGFLQKQRMMNRPPSNVGGGVNRVGQQDQQGALSRAMQRGTGRRPMSRRGGFPGRGPR